ncbi:hypothetical protein A0J61_08498 [Choanephora cucurbitarum]|uniref:F-box domain-containing protein n=1 Tax=Choanephora cucurbitarum TaxID=101091 RepID=A0A1C7N367_9FUNG|nr:hypothetical protein A0J61_08498 [Choanephora cucurbitarum]
MKQLYLCSRSIATASRKEHTIDQQVYLSQNDLELLSNLCPELEVLDFDVQQWQHLNIDSNILPWKRLQRCAPIHFCNLNAPFLTAFNGSRLVELTVLYHWEELDILMTRLNAVPTLTKLTLNVVDDSTGTSPHISQSLQTLHTSLPQLKQLSLVCNISPCSEALSITTRDSRCLSPFKQPSRLRNLLLHGHVDSVKWFDFIAMNYPDLESLSLTNLSNSRFGTKWMWQRALIRMIQKLPLLKSLSLGGENISQLFASNFALELKKATCSIQDVSIDLHAYQAIESCQFLLSVAALGVRQLKHLKLHVWEQLPGWSGATSNLYKCQQLVSLELSLSVGLIGQFPYTSFLIDKFLKYMSCLQDFVLVGADVQVACGRLQERVEDNQKFALRKLKICRSKIRSHETTSKFLSYCCPKLKQLVLDECKIERKGKYQKSLFSNRCHLSFMYSNLSKVKLSSLLVYFNSVQVNDYIGVELLISCSRKMIWYSIDRSIELSGHPVYKLCDRQDEHLELFGSYNSCSPSQKYAQAMPCSYIPTIGIITLHLKSAPFELYLDDLRIPTN